MLTVPLIGWAPILGPNRSKLASFSIKKYGPQTDNDAQWFPDAGNGIDATAKTPIANDPNDANRPVNATYQQDWIRHLTNRWGSSGAGGVRYYFMDNEPSIWHSTHRDVHPEGVKMAEMRDRIVEYAAKVKDADPGAMVLGPEEWGWSGYFYSGYDQQWGAKKGWGKLPDKASNGGRDYLPWLLDELRKNSDASGRRLLDAFTVHFYPQSGEFGDDTSAGMQSMRNRSTRALWDPAYVDASWIGEVVMLIPRMKGWVQAWNPGLKTGITEYNWGAENHINGATAQADILGIFGREGLDLATRWTTPASGTPTFKAIKMYRNYDGKKSGFGDVSVSASGPNPDRISVFAAQRTSDRALTVMAIDKQLSGMASISLVVSNFQIAGAAQVWQLTVTNVISRLADVAPSNGVIKLDVPA
jgi:hypothetical protein